MKRTIALLLLLTALLDSCIGVGVIGSKRSELELADVFIGETLPVSTRTLIERRGEPDEIEVGSDGGELWTYRHGLRMGGLAIFVVIPLPLMVPVGWVSSSFSVRDGIVISASRTNEATTLYVAGVVPGMCYEVGVGVFHR